MVGLSYAIRLVLESSNPEVFVFCFPFSKFLSLDSFFRVRLSVMVRFRVRVSVRVRF